MRKFQTGLFLFLLGVCLSFGSLLISHEIKFSYSNLSLSAFSVSDSPEYEFDSIPIESCIIIANNDTFVYPGQVIELGVQTVPDYALVTSKHIEYKVLTGQEFSTIENSALIINFNARIGSEISIIASIDGKESDNVLTFSVVEIPVEEIKILNPETSIIEGGSLKLVTSILPENVSSKELTYSIISGAQYASIWQDGIIRVNNKLPSGDLDIVVRVQSISNEKVYVDKKISLYVPTSSLVLSSNDFNPCIGSSVELFPIYSLTASYSLPVYTIIEGSEYVDSIIGNSLKIKNNINKNNPQIKLNCSRDGCVSNVVTLNITIPVEKINILSDKNIVKQGETIKLNAILFPSNATNQNTIFQIVSGVGAVISADGYLTVLKDSNPNSVVKVIARSGDVVSDEYELLITEPDFLLFSDKDTPAVDSENGADVELSIIHNIVNAEQPVYQIVSGNEFGAINGNMLHIKSGLKTLNPQIIVRAKIGEYESNDLTINIKILAERIVFNENCVDEVEQKKSYVFSTTILPLNAALINADVNYTLNVDNSVASISEHGVLDVSENAPIGTIITIIANGPDGVRATHDVIVRPVYAEKISLYETKNRTVVRPGAVLNFDAVFSGKNNISECVKQYSLRIDGYPIASVNDKSVIVNSIEQIEQKNPHFTVVAVSEQDNMTIMDTWDVEVYIPVVDVVLTQNIHEIEEGKTVLISDLFSSEIFPKNANTDKIKYSIVNGNKYVKLINNAEIIVSGNLPYGNFTFDICASAEGIISNSISFVMYVATESLEVSVDNYNPMSLISSGDYVNINTIIDTRATPKTPNIRAVYGADLIQNLTADGFEIKSNLRIVDNLDKRITLEIERDGIIKSINVIVYIPVEELSLVAHSVTRGTGENLIDVVHGINDDYCGFKILSITDGCSLSITNPLKLMVPQYFSAGTPIVVNYKSLDLLGKEFTTTLYVDALSQTDLTKFTKYFGCDSDGVLISQTAPQLASNRNVNIELTYQGESLSAYGLQIQDVSIINNSGEARLINNKINVRAGNNGKASLDVVAYVRDGSFGYGVELPQINIFNPVDFSALDLDVNMSEQGKIVVGDKVSIAGWNSGWTLNIDDLACDNIEAGTLSSDYAFTDKTPCQNFAIIINLTNKQKYNGRNWEEITKTDSVKQFNFTGIEYHDKNNKIIKRTWKKYIFGMKTEIILEGQLDWDYGAEQTQWVDESNNRYNIYRDTVWDNNTIKYYYYHSEKYSKSTDLILTPHFSSTYQEINVLGSGEHTISRDWVRGDWYKIDLELQLLKNIGLGEVGFEWKTYRKNGNSETSTHVRLDYRYNDYGDNVGYYGDCTFDVCGKEQYKHENYYFGKSSDTLLQNGLWIRGCYIDDKKNTWKEGQILWIFGGHDVYGQYTIGYSYLTIYVSYEKEVERSESYMLPPLRPAVI